MSGRFDALTKIEEEPVKTTLAKAADSPTVKKSPAPSIKLIDEEKLPNKSHIGNSGQQNSEKASKQESKQNVTIDDVTTSSHHDVNYRRWRDIIEDTEVHNSALRLTNEESYAVEDLVSELRRKYKIKTSMNEIARLGLLYIINDFKKDKPQALIIKVKKS
jgi:hypothetical protein